MLTYIRNSGAIEKAQAVSDLYLQKALDEIDELTGLRREESICPNC